MKSDLECAILHSKTIFIILLSLTDTTETMPNQPHNMCKSLEKENQNIHMCQ